MKTSQIEMTKGSLLKPMILFCIPIILSGILQLLFNAADIIVVGKFAGDGALAAVGATSSLINLLVNWFIGLTGGAGVVMSQCVGAQDEEGASKTLHTSITIGILGGIFLTFVGLFLSRQLLEMMGTPFDVIDGSTLYMKIYFCGMPALMIYNFGATILRACGDTKRPLYFLTFAGILNVIFNLFFVIVLHMNVDGVAYATIISQYVSAFLVMMSLINSRGFLQFRFSDIKISKEHLKRILKIGIPAGLQGVIFSISNVIIQSSINSFGKIVIAANTAGSSIEAFLYVTLNSIYQTSLTFTGQNVGAKKYSRIDKIMVKSMAVVGVLGVCLSAMLYFLGPYLISIYTNDPEVVRVGMIRLLYCGTLYFLIGFMETPVGVLRGMGYSVMPMIVSLIGACLSRIIWVFTIFQIYRTLEVLYISYPISWALTALVHILCYLKVRKKLPKEDTQLV